MDRLRVVHSSGHYDAPIEQGDGTASRGRFDAENAHRVQVARLGVLLIP